jgi:quinohemoprotein ethanol dehydrogenase
MEQRRTGEIPKMNASAVPTILAAQRRLTMTKICSGLFVLAGALLCMGAPTASAQAPGTAQDRVPTGAKRVNGDFIRANAAQKTPDWPSYGLDYAESRFSKLDQVNAGNVKQLGLAWSYNLESTRGVEATPLVVDGVMYVTASWSVVHAIDTRTGQRLWTFDPQVDKSKGFRGCCDVVNRGVALYEGRVYVAAYDGRLIALDAGTGKKVWEKNTIDGQKGSYTITGAPRVFKGKVIIGNGGAEYGVRGYVTAYDAKTGDQKWRWFVVPGDPAKPFEDESMARAAKTWDPSGKYWEAGGGGTAWDSFAFDPELNLMYVGTGNGSPWAHKARSPKGGDNLYLGSVVALNPDTGKYVWHYQETPGDNWDYTSTQSMILANVQLGGKARKVLLHAPKNGFFFVIDRTNGKFISAKNFVDVNWATGYDKNGRPIEIAAARQNEKPGDSIPGPFGAHNWHPMSFNPQTGLAYLPAQNIPVNLMDDKDWKFDQNAPGRPHAALGWNTAMSINAEPPKSKPFGRLVAWGPRGAEGGLGCGLRLALERRHAHHRRQPRVPGHGRWPPGGLRGEDRREAVGNGHRHRRGGRAHHLHGRRQAVRVGRGGMGRRVRPRAARHRKARPWHGLHLRGRRRRQDARVRAVPHGRAGAGREVRPRQGPGRHHALREQLRVLPRCAGRRPRRQHSEPRLHGRGLHREPRQVRAQGPGHGARHARFHGQALDGRHREHQGLHPGHGGRDPAEVRQGVAP